MKRLRIKFAALALFAVTVPCAPAQDAAPRAGDAGEIKVTARKYAFDPNPIRVKKGDHVKLVITAVDHDHGFKLETLQIDQLLKKGEATTVEFTADQAGTFTFQCSTFCGLGHKKMKGELIVE
jgi:cytochrome c oxidase subunit 2